MKRIGFTNFRRFRQFPVLGINDLTFLVGSNNTGKSTMVKAILLVYDNLRSLRSFQKDGKWEVPKFKFDASKTRDLHIGTFWRALNTKSKDMGDEHITFTATLNQLTYDIIVTSNKDNTDDLYETMAPVECITVTDHKNKVLIKVDYANQLLTATTDYDGNRPQSISDELDKFISFAYNNDLLNRIYALSAVWQEHAELLKTLIEDVLSSLSDNYIEYFYAHGVTQKVVYSFEDKNDYIAAIIHDYENERKLFDKDEELFIQKWMTKFGIGKGIKIKSVSGAAFSVNILDDLHQKDGINLVDMGIGYIQLILLLLKLNTFISRNRRKKNKTTLIIIEEPEQNLHPRLQSMLTDLFASIHEEYGIRFLIETHSEYVIRAAQVKVGDSEYNSQEQLDENCPYTVYYFPEDDIPYDMGFTSTGKFVNDFREGFYDEASRLFMNVLRRERNS